MILWVEEDQDWKNTRFLREKFKLRVHGKFEIQYMMGGVGDLPS